MRIVEPCREKECQEIEEPCGDPQGTVARTRRGNRRAQYKF
jgi:hypothetical protein